jgi:NitT/TauT family transport system permease protein
MRHPGELNESAMAIGLPTGEELPSTAAEDGNKVLPLLSSSGATKELWSAGEALARKVERMKGRGLRQLLVDWQVGILRVLLLAMVLGSWEATSRLNLVSSLFISRPSAVFTYLIGALRTDEFWTAIGATTLATVFGLLFGTVGGVLMGLFFGRFPRFGDVLNPYMTIVNSLPRIALAPLFIAWFGISITAKVVLSSSLVFFILWINTCAGLQSADPDTVTIVRSLGASRNQVFLKAVLPSAAPSIFAGIRLGVIYSILGVVVQEMIAARNGIGVLIVSYSGVFRMDAVFGLLVVLAALAGGLTAIIGLVQRAVLAWNKFEQ